MLAANKTLDSDTSEVPIGYKIRRERITLEVKEYSHDRVWCYCSKCGYVVPALNRYTKENLESWFDLHISLFPKEHAKKL